MTKVYIIPFRVKPSNNSIMPTNLLGAYVDCYTAGLDYVEAINKSLKKLSDDGLLYTEILPSVYEMDSNDWEVHVKGNWPEYASTLLSKIEFEEAIKNDKVVYGPFISYDQQA